MTAQFRINLQPFLFILMLYSDYETALRVVEPTLLKTGLVQIFKKSQVRTLYVRTFSQFYYKTYKENTVFITFYFFL